VGFSSGLSVYHGNSWPSVVYYIFLIALRTSITSPVIAQVYVGGIPHDLAAHDECSHDP